ncbi:2-oxoacid:acceptor oxidoreductase family protein [Namhaeicola litoreus]|uniref:2-oxoacid:acceptor oxidoreductase family protein n=1 Tax=Namhaeicola litoreus TaxID=1052145 RepID=A0ABW3Y2Y4_9FLAO
MKSNIHIVGLSKHCAKTMLSVIEAAAASEKVHTNRFDVYDDNHEIISCLKAISVHHESGLQDPSARNIVDIFITSAPLHCENALNCLNENSWLITDANAFEDILNHPEKVDVYKKIKSHDRHIMITAQEIASEHGDERVCGLVLLGAASKLIPISESGLVKSIYKILLNKKESIIRSNIEAFREGKKASEEYLSSDLS